MAIAYNFNQERNVISDLKNLTGDSLVPNRVVVLDANNQGGVTTPSEGDTKILGILKESDETTDGYIPNGRPCDIVVSGEYPVEIAGDVNVGDILVVADTLGRVRALTANELAPLSGESTKIGVLGIAKESATYVSGKSVLVVCVIQKSIIEVPVTS